METAGADMPMVWNIFYDTILMISGTAGYPLQPRGQCGKAIKDGDGITLRSTGRSCFLL